MSGLSNEVVYTGSRPRLEHWKTREKPPSDSRANDITNHALKIHRTSIFLPTNKKEKKKN